MVRNVFRGDLSDVPMRGMIVAEVRHIGLLSELVPLRGKHAVATDRIEAFPDAAYSGKQINKIEPERR